MFKSILKKESTDINNELKVGEYLDYFQVGKLQGRNVQEVDVLSGQFVLVQQQDQWQIATVMDPGALNLTTTVLVFNGKRSFEVLKEKTFTIETCRKGGKNQFSVTWNQHKQVCTFRLTENSADLGKPIEIVPLETKVAKKTLAFVPDQQLVNEIHAIVLHVEEILKKPANQTDCYLVILERLIFDAYAERLTPLCDSKEVMNFLNDLKFIINTQQSLVDQRSSDLFILPYPKKEEIANLPGIALISHYQQHIRLEEALSEFQNWETAFGIATSFITEMKTRMIVEMDKRGFCLDTLEDQLNKLLDEEIGLD